MIFENILRTIGYTPLVKINRLNPNNNVSIYAKIERRKMIKSFGAKVILTDAKLGTDGAIMKAREMVKENSEKYFMPDQFSNKFNKIAH